MRQRVGGFCVLEACVYVFTISAVRCAPQQMAALVREFGFYYLNGVLWNNNRFRKLFLIDSSE